MSGVPRALAEVSNCESLPTCHQQQQIGVYHRQNTWFGSLETRSFSLKTAHSLPRHDIDGSLADFEIEKKT